MKYLSCVIPQPNDAPVVIEYSINSPIMAQTVASLFEKHMVAPQFFLSLFDTKDDLFKSLPQKTVKQHLIFCPDYPTYIMYDGKTIAYLLLDSELEQSVLISILKASKSYGKKYKVERNLK